MRISLKNLQAAKLAITLAAMGVRSKMSGLYIEADTESNGLRVRGTAEQVQEIKEIVARLDQGQQQPGNLRTITIENGSAATIAEAIAEIFPRMRANPIKLVLPGSLEGIAPKKPAAEKKDAKSGKRARTDHGHRVRKPHDPHLRRSRVLLDVFAHLVRIIINTEAPICELPVIRIQHAKAVDIAKLLDETFNRGKAARIRVVADPNTNSILLGATPLDRFVIIRLLRELDVPANPAGTK